MKSMYDRIRELRKDHRMSQEDLARKVGYHGRSMIARVEAGEIDLPQSKIVAFAKALDTTTEYLMDGTPGYMLEFQTLDQIREDQRVLFRLSRKAKPEAVRAAVAVLKSYEDANNGF